ncbi:MAG: hypothetical protein GC159_14690 [Phycisphaera sp.]|nr:hypothetical protein [Phycisphaera sp.]
MRKFMTMVLAALVITAFSGMVSAADKKEKKPVDPAEAFKKKDKDADGKLTFEEFAGKAAADADKAEGLKKKFEKADKNSDGSLSLEEFTAAMSGGEKKKKDNN